MEVVQNNDPDSLVNSQFQFCPALVVAVETHLVHRKARLHCRPEFPARDDVSVAAFFIDDLVDGQA